MDIVSHSHLLHSKTCLTSLSICSFHIAPHEHMSSGSWYWNIELVMLSQSSSFFYRCSYLLPISTCTYVVSGWGCCHGDFPLHCCAFICCLPMHHHPVSTLWAVDYRCGGGISIIVMQVPRQSVVPSSQFIENEACIVWAWWMSHTLYLCRSTFY